jgi:outer membrane protein OmpA-like peptidoglycan-associated protein
LLLIGWFSGAPALAQSVSFGFVTNPSSSVDPGLYVVPEADVESIYVECEVGNRRQNWEREGVTGGSQELFSWPFDPNVSHADCYVRAVFPSGHVEEVELPVDYQVGATLSVDYSNAEADLEAHTLTVEVTAPVTSAEIVAWGAGRVQLGSDTIALDAGPGEVTVPWVGEASEVVLLEIKFFGEGGWASFSFSPWMLDLPHEDVLFDTNMAEIPASEEWKLQATLRDLREVIAQYGDIVPVKLYVGGCTDTVGNSSSNSALSRNRARAIGEWLREHGFTHPIYYYGFGEGWLAQPTGDGVDNAANRRAVYIIGANPPPPSSAVPRARWREL